MLALADRSPVPLHTHALTLEDNCPGFKRWYFN
jgi:hypothetical protein